MLEYIEIAAIAAVGAFIGSSVVAFFIIRNLPSILAAIPDALVSSMLELLSKHNEHERVSVAQKKKEAIQKIGPKTFYYIDESQVKDLYPQVFQELEPKRIQTRESKQIKKGISAKLRFIEPKYERGRAEETTKIYDVELRPPMMYNKVEQYLLEKGKITFGLEEFEFEKSPIDDFKSMCEKMQNKFEFNIPDDLQAIFVADKMREFALQCVKELSGSTGYVAIQTEFSVIDIPGDAYILSLVHPLNEYFPLENKKIRIQVTCAKECLTSSGVSTFKKDKSVKITCLGKVVSWNNEDKILEISPIAIY
jgi:hypothetical protein